MKSDRTRPTRALLVAIVAVAFHASRCLAESGLFSGDKLHVNGFGTLGVARIDAPDGWAFTRNLNQAKRENELRADVDTRLGLQVNYQPNERFEFVGQVVGSDLDGDAKSIDIIQLAYAAFRPDADWTIRAGRVNLDAFALSDHRDVGLTYGFIRPPVEFYSRLPTSIDGADITRIWTTPDAQWRAKIYGGSTAVGPGELRLRMSPFFGLMVSRESDGLLLRVSAVRAKLANTVPSVLPLTSALQGMQALPVPQVAAEAAALEYIFASKGKHTNYIAAGAIMDRNDWLLSVEINDASIEGTPIAGFISGYISIGRRIGSLSVFVTESIAARKSDALATPDWATALAMFGPAVALPAQGLAEAATAAANYTAGEQQTTSLGVRWDISPQVALKAQWDRTHVEVNGGGLWRTSTLSEATLNVVGVSLDFVF